MLFGITISPKPSNSWTPSSWSFENEIIKSLFSMSFIIRQCWSFGGSSWLGFQYERLRTNSVDTRPFQGGQAWFGPVLNSSVHVFMYAYYGLSVIPSLRDKLWWKRYITLFQLVRRRRWTPLLIFFRLFVDPICFDLHSHLQRIDSRMWLSIMVRGVLRGNPSSRSIDAWFVGDNTC